MGQSQQRIRAHTHTHSHEHTHARTHAARTQHARTHTYPHTPAGPGLGDEEITKKKYFLVSKAPARYFLFTKKLNAHKYRAGLGDDEV